jgi:hypothetical protein
MIVGQVGKITFRRKAVTYHGDLYFFENKNIDVFNNGIESSKENGRRGRWIYACQAEVVSPTKKPVPKRRVKK